MVMTNEYGNIHRGVLQTLMGNGAMEAKALNEIFLPLSRKLVAEQVEAEDLNGVIELINTRIAAFDQKIEMCEYGLNKSWYYVFCSTAKTSMSALQATYSTDDLYLFKLILTEISKSERLNIAPREALNLCSEIPKVSLVRGESLVDSWIQKKYLIKHSDNQIYFGPKLLTEFKELLQTMGLTYLKSCMLCEKLAVYDERCDSCRTVFHASCIQKFIKRTPTCPSCKEQWTTAKSD